MLKETLGEKDIFAFLPVYYAGGTASFTPTSEEVAAEYQTQLPGQILYFPTRPEAIQWIKSGLNDGDITVVMGARDNSLSDWSKSISDIK